MFKEEYNVQNKLKDFSFNIFLHAWYKIFIKISLSLFKSFFNLNKT